MNALVSRHMYLCYQRLSFKATVSFTAFGSSSEPLITTQKSSQQISRFFPQNRVICHSDDTRVATTTLAQHHNHFPKQHRHLSYRHNYHHMAPRR